MTLLTRLVGLSILACLSLLPVQRAQAQNVSDLQLCIWACLSNSPGAASQQYNTCVERRCSEVSDEIPSSPQKGWSFTRLAPNDPPYLDGAAVNADATDGRLGLSYICGRDGASYLSFAGTMVDGLRLKVAQQQPVWMRIDRHPGFKASFGEYEGALISSKISPRSKFMAQMHKGTQLSIRIGNDSVRIMLSGSSRALGKSLDYCN
ncbi:hypothetical protein SAMN04515647_0810 [Cohaesibacter sp. ES.047]|uniref:hypothetical protein n=1 Tax=Cohaesibacter sp. ES.047 TaxID=1798205 RepID=UPI000BB7E8A1|nr:hypothetical protein [Cohaesibacter sp. ES.047]SNY90639.1 hypothetical protein SAMN04515647_0810 [Cohaesibacter sp. ES.047]